MDLLFGSVGDPGVSSLRQKLRRAKLARVSSSRCSRLVLANSDLIDTLGVVILPSIPLRALIVRALGSYFRFLPEPCGASARDPRPASPTRRSATLCQATETDFRGSILVGLAVRHLD